jgi:hypothetical protein
MARDPQCTICADKATRIAVDRLSSEGRSQRDIAKAIGVSKSAIHRHQHHARKPGAKAKRARQQKSVQADPGANRRRKNKAVQGRCVACGLIPDGVDTQTLLRRAERLLGIAEGIAAQATADEDSKLALMAVDRANKALDTLARATGMIGDGGANVTVNVGAQQTVKTFEEGLRIVLAQIEDDRRKSAVLSYLSAARAGRDFPDFGSLPPVIERPALTGEIIEAVADGGGVALPVSSVIGSVSDGDAAPFEAIENARSRSPATAYSSLEGDSDG